MDYHKNLYTYFTEKSMSQKKFGHPRMTQEWINPEFDFSTIPLSPLKMWNKFQIFWPPIVPWYTGSVFGQKNWSSIVLGSSGWHNPKIQGQIYPSKLISQEPAVGISKNFFPKCSREDNLKLKKLLSSP